MKNSSHTSVRLSLTDLCSLPADAEVLTEVQTQLVYSQHLEKEKQKREREREHVSMFTDDVSPHDHSFLGRVT